MFQVIPDVKSFEVTDEGVRFTVTPQPIEFVVEKGNVTYNITSGGNTVQVVASENLGGHRVVTVDGFYASKDVTTDKFKVLGITTGAVSIGSPATVTTFGEVEESSWNWTVGNPVFLNTNGLLTQTAPTTGFRIIIGIPETTTSMFVNISEPITLI